ncbi:hypothetical protein [Nocardia caishijiensis]|uniref:Uncharacterized protein n=1 Tax=Nocardia caishijiensis TaxID=184756 RepID=A0ABQ6YMR2_9NOCA|nr:hypothetical protein [Nocardia caishijiensis]KAF0847077.1 hypothetical protein FNL39_104499 [Nocardia caishijiensis]
MTARNQRPDRLNLPADIDVLLALVEDDVEPDAEAAAAGARIAQRLLAAEHSAIPLSPAARRGVMRVPGWTVRPLAASSRDAAASSRVVQKQTDQELGIEFTRTPAGAEQTRISVQSFGPGTAAGDVVRVAVHMGEERTEVLVVLYIDADGSLTGQIVTRALSLAEHLEISILPGAALGNSHTGAITDAVRCSLTAGRNAWRRVAKGLPVGDPVRAAIVTGLS